MIRVELSTVDVLELCPELSERQAEKLLDRISDEVQQAMIAAGWEVLADIVKAQ